MYIVVRTNSESGSSNLKLYLRSKSSCSSTALSSSDSSLDPITSEYVGMLF